MQNLSFPDCGRILLCHAEESYPLRTQQRASDIGQP